MLPEPALQYLKSRPNIWIPITSDETVDSLRRLRRAGHDIRTRIQEGRREACFVPPEPPRQISLNEELAKVAETVFQDDIQQVQEIDRLLSEPCPHAEASRQARTDAIGTVCMDCGEVFTTVDAMTPGSAGRSNALRAVKVGKDSYRYEVSTQTCPQCGEEYLVRDDHVQRSPRHKQWASGALSGPEIPVPQQQPTYKFPLDMPRSRIEFGMVITCPRCHGKRLGERYGKGKQSGIKLPAEDWCRDPSRKDERCMRCNGWGIIPNQGPVVSDSQLSAGRERDYG